MQKGDIIELPNGGLGLVDIMQIDDSLIAYPIQSRMEIKCSKDVLDNLLTHKDVLNGFNLLIEKLEDDVYNVEFLGKWK
jgi:hypothetical protein